MKYSISFMVTYFREDNKWILYNWENGENITVDDPKHPLFYILENNILKFSEFAVNGKRYDFELLEEKKFITFDQENVRERVRLAYRHANRPTDISITLMPASTNCNFSCIYCSQNSIYDDYMGDREIDAISNFISSQNPEILRIDYFGGEPLLNVNFILKMSERAKYISKNMGFEFSGSSITTNGYLLSREVANNLLYNNINSFQVTIDGNKKFHDSYRFLKNGEETFDVIYNNIKYMFSLNKRFLLTLRVNFTEASSKIEERSSFLEMIKNDFHNDDRLLIMIQPVGNWKNEIDYNNMYCDPKKAKKIQYEYEYEAEKNGINLMSSALYGDVEAHHCYASKKNNFILYPFRKYLEDLGMPAQKCTFCSPGNMNEIGFLKEDGTFLYNKNYEKWLNPDPFKEKKCRNCHFVLACYGCSCPLQNNISNKVICPPEKMRPHEEVRRILRFVSNNL